MDDAIIGKSPLKITEKSAVSLGLMLFLLGSIAGGVFYVATEMGVEQAMRARVDRIEAKQDVYNNSLQTIDSRLSNIEGYLHAQDQRKARKNE